MPDTAFESKSRSRRQQVEIALDDYEKEAELWKKLENIANRSIDFWTGFLNLKKGANELDLSLNDRQRLLVFVRAMCWVESRHGSGSGNQPARDPMQCGNPADVWWKQLAGIGSKFDRFEVGGTGSPNYDANQLPAAAVAARVEVGARLSALAELAKGHKNTAFTPIISLYWGLPHFIWKTNKPDRRPTYRFDKIDREELLDGAERYNGGGNPGYREEVLAAVEAIGGPSLFAEVRSRSEELVETLESLIEQGKITFDRPGLKDELLGNKVTDDLQALVAHLAGIDNLTLSSIIRSEGHHGSGRAFDVGNEGIADHLLSNIATDQNVATWKIDEIIFDAKIANSANDRNKWNYDRGRKHAYGSADLDDHNDHIHFAVAAPARPSTSDMLVVQQVSLRRSRVDAASGTYLPRKLQLLDFRTYPPGHVLPAQFTVGGFGIESIDGQLDITQVQYDRGLRFSDLRIVLPAPVDELILQAAGYAGELSLAMLDASGDVLERLDLTPDNQMIRLQAVVPGTCALELKGGNGEGVLVELIVA